VFKVEKSKLDYAKSLCNTISHFWDFMKLFALVQKLLLPKVLFTEIVTSVQAVTPTVTQAHRYTGGGISCPSPGIMILHSCNDYLHVNCPHKKERGWRKVYLDKSSSE